ncbi:MAG: HD domain-containing protein, partial [Spirochaetes bacterium]|nr:HD domain-containing protein [Spirochaetota bacterium]
MKKITLQKDIQQQILNRNKERENYLLSKFACKSDAGIRRNPYIEKVDDIQNIRPPFFHDTDKIIHSMSYSRYIDKTQVFFLFENDHLTHRVLHVQFVSKIARVIGRCLCLNEDLIEAIALGHDLGHVPYGHDGEEYLNNICKEKGEGFFCHNAQSFRFLYELENKGKGLNLTLQVLDGILCHNGELFEKELMPDYNKTWDRLLEEYSGCRKIENYSKKIRPMTLEGCVVRVSDIIAYIGRDIEDAIRVDLIKRKDIPDSAAKILGNKNDRIINSLAVDIMNNSYGKKYIKFSPAVYKALKELRDFNYRNIYYHPFKNSESKKIEYMFKYLYNKYISDISNK